MMEPDPGTNSVRGTVVVAGTEVLLSDVPVTLRGETVSSDGRGRYLFDDVAVGDATLSASAPGYLPYERRVQILEGANDFDIPLIPED